MHLFHGYRERVLLVDLHIQDLVKCSYTFSLLIFRFKGPFYISLGHDSH